MTCTRLPTLYNYTTHDPREFFFFDRDVGTWDGALQLGYNESDLRAINKWEASVNLDIEGGVTGNLQPAQPIGPRHSY
jgi:hypothetical protein